MTVASSQSVQSKYTITVRRKPVISLGATLLNEQDMATFETLVAGKHMDRTQESEPRNCEY